MKRNNFKINNWSNSILFSYNKRFAAKNRASGLCLIFFIFALLSSCSDSGTVGGGIIGPGTEIEVDTLEVTNIRTDSLNSYSGNLNHFSAGKFHDPLFGNLTAYGLMKPSLAGNGDTLSIDDSTNITLNLVFDANTTYGDTLAEQRFDLYEITEIWRGNEWRLNDEIERAAAPVTSFTVNEDDSIEIPLPDEWVQKYGEYFNSTEDNRDTTYSREIHGFKIVPQNEGKIVTVNPFNTTFIATNLNLTTESTAADTMRVDSLNFGLHEWAYSLQRTEVSPQSIFSSKIISTLEKVIRFQFDFTFENLETRNISKVELVFFRNNLLLDETISQAGAAAKRPEAETLRLYYIEGDELPQRLTGGPTVATATYNSEDKAYIFDITGFVASGAVERLPEDLTFYITVGGSEGVIRSTLLYNSEAESKAPEVIVTSIETENN